MWDLIVQYLKGNMETIKKAPIPFIGILFIGIAGGGYFTWNYAKDKYDGIIQNKNATIEMKNSHIAQLRSVKADAKSLIFNLSGNILIDMGAKHLIESLVVDNKKQADGADIVIRLITKKHLEHLPIIEPVQSVFGIVWKRKREGENLILFRGHIIQWTDHEPLNLRLEILKAQ